ncbi:hypothetical protein HYV49_06015, partial [Candidatus Pacearchaeota archaeon]|nr:hypothetical protein [Candidatus Pacearchaeota archaeon]
SFQLADINDVVFRKFAGFIRIFQVIDIQDIALRILYSLRAIFDKFLINDLVSVFYRDILIVYKTNVSDTFSVNQKVSTDILQVRYLPQNLNLDILISRTISALRNVFAISDLNDAISRFITIPRFIARLIDVNDAVFRTFIGLRTIGQLVDINEFVTSLSSYIRSASQSININSAAARLTLIFKSIAQLLNANLITGRFVSFSRNVNQGFSVLTDLSTLKGFIVKIYDSININTAVKRIASFFRIIFDRIINNILCIVNGKNCVPEPTPPAAETPPSSGGGGGEKGKEGNKTFSLSIGKINDVILNKKDKKILSVSLTNTGTKPLNSCRLVGSSGAGNWTDSTDKKDLASGESKEFSFTLKAPNETIDGEYKLSLNAECDKAKASGEFKVFIITDNFVFYIKNIEERDNFVIISYEIDELSGNDYTVNIEYWLEKAGERFLIISKAVNLTAFIKIEDVIIIEKAMIPDIEDTYINIIGVSEYGQSFIREIIKERIIIFKSDYAEQQDYGLSIEDISDIIIRKNEKKTSSVKVLNNGTKFINNCRLSGGFSFESWIDSKTITDLSAGQTEEFIFTIAVPENVKERDYEVVLRVRCDEIEAARELNVFVITDKFEFKINNVIDEGDVVRVLYEAEEKSNNTQTLNIDYSLERNNEKFLEGTKTLQLNALSKLDDEIVLSKAELVSGIYTLKIRGTSEYGQSVVEENILISKNPLTGLVTLIGTPQGLIALGAVLLTILLFIFIAIRRVWSKRTGTQKYEKGGVIHVRKTPPLRPLKPQQTKSYKQVKLLRPNGYKKLKDFELKRLKDYGL